MTALKAQWIVRAGLYPGHIDDDHSVSWKYTSLMHKKDTDMEVYNAMMNKAHDYAKSLSGPMNWVTIEFMWL